MERYLIETTLFDGNEYYICKGFPTKGNAVSQEFKKYYPEYKVQLSKVDYEEENCYFPNETFYEWYVYIDCRCRCLLVEQKVEGISKGFYHVYENDVVSVTSEKNNRRIMICSEI